MMKDCSVLASRPRVAVSACLLGQAVRYDGRDKRCGFVADALARFFELVPLCPEVGIGLGVPRAPLHLVQSARGVRAVGVEDATLDVTRALQDFAQTRLRELADVDGLILKSRSPSCAVSDASIVAPGQGVVGVGMGVFAQQVRALRADLPLVDESALAAVASRAGFVARVYLAQRWRMALAGGLSAPCLQAFHAVHLWVIRAQDPLAFDALLGGLERLSAAALADAARRYGQALQVLMQRPLCARSQAAVLLAMLRESIDTPPQRLVSGLEAFAQGRIAFAKALRMTLSALRQQGDLSAQAACYFASYPADLLDAGPLVLTQDDHRGDL